MSNIGGFILNITIKETSLEDLKNVMDLWNDGEVMFYVGFPNGLGVTIEQLERWLANNQKAWSLYERIGFMSKPRPTFLEPDETYLEITKALFRM